jgi:hypothetical protein
LHDSGGAIRTERVGHVGDDPVGIPAADNRLDFVLTEDLSDGTDELTSAFFRRTRSLELCEWARKIRWEKVQKLGHTRRACRASMPASKFNHGERTLVIVTHRIPKRPSVNCFESDWTHVSPELMS